MLFGKNADVDNVNAKELAQLPGSVSTFTSQDEVRACVRVCMRETYTRMFVCVCVQCLYDSSKIITKLRS